jgi:hypothetical protein
VRHGKNEVRLQALHSGYIHTTFIQDSHRRIHTRHAHIKISSHSYGINSSGCTTCSIGIYIILSGSFEKTYRTPPAMEAERMVQMLPARVMQALILRGPLMKLVQRMSAAKRWCSEQGLGWGCRR